MFRFHILLLGLLCPLLVIAQTHTGKKLHTFDPRSAAPDFNAQLRNLEAPTPDGDSYRSFLMRQKIESRKRFPLKSETPEKKKTHVAPQPGVGDGFYVDFKPPFSQGFAYSGGIPNDNTMALSNDGILVAALNSTVWAYDLQQDTALFMPTHHISLSRMANSSMGGRYYDPKLIYDKNADRFILVFLKDNVPSTSAIIVCFSSTNNPLDPWYVYSLPGNPLSNGRWTDFPAISLTENELFITGNLIVPGVSWQVGFDGSVIWQIDKQAGYSNDSTLPAKFHNPPTFGGKYTRNLHPVQNIDQGGSRQYFLSNRNFDITNDTIFVMYIDGTQYDPSSEVVVGMGKTTPNYGVPPNGRQADTDTTDPAKGLQTNDGRVLGAITNGEWIQFVSNTVNPATGFSAIYHGMITQPATPSQKISGTILGDPVLDFGYPNLAYTGNEDCDLESIIGFNFTSPTDFPGVGAIYFGNDTTHSELLRIKEGEGYVDKHSDSYERWGDYFGIQKRHNTTSEIWLAGFYGLATNGSGTWLSQLSSPDSSRIMATAELAGELLLCDGQLKLQASGGVPPYTYTFNDESGADPFYNAICEGDTVVYEVKDRRGCVVAGEYIAPDVPTRVNTGVYPNPFASQATVQFRLERGTRVSAYIYDLRGTMVAKLIDQDASPGLNELVFNLASLRVGEYVVRLYAADEIVLVEKMIKIE